MTHYIKIICKGQNTTILHWIPETSSENTAFKLTGDCLKSHKEDYDIEKLREASSYDRFREVILPRMIGQCLKINHDHFLLT